MNAHMFKRTHVKHALCVCLPFVFLIFVCMYLLPALLYFICMPIHMSVGTNACEELVVSKATRTFSLSMPLNTENQDNFYKLLQVRIFLSVLFVVLQLNG